MVTFYRREHTAESEGVSEGVNRLFFYIRTNPGKRVPQIEKALKIPKKTLERWLKNLKKQHKIGFRGSPKSGGYWEISGK